MRTRRHAIQVALLVTAAGCGTTGQEATAPPAVPPPAPTALAPVAVVPPEPVFVPVSVARPSQVGSVVTVAPSKIVGDLDALSKRLGLPMQGGQELLSALGSLGVVGDAAHFRQAWDRLDSAAAVAVVWVLPPKSQAKGYCAALTFKDAAGAKQTLDELGAAGDQRDGVFERKVPGQDSIWAAIKGRTLLVSNAPDALLLGGGLAEAAQVSPSEGQVVISVLPQALAKATGQSNDALVARITSALGSAAQASETKTQPGSQRALVALAESLARMALQAADVRLVLEVGPQGGVLVRVEMVPLPGTDLATRTLRRAPYAFDDRLPISDDRTVVMALGDMSPWFLPFAKAFEASGPAGHSMQRDLTQWFGMVGDVSCVVEPASAGMTSLCSSSLKPGVDPKRAPDAAVALLVSQNAWEAELEARKASRPKIKRGKDMVEVEKKIETSDSTARAVAQAMAGGDTVKTVIAVKAGRLVQATGRNAREMVARYGAPQSSKNAPLVAAGLANTQGTEGMASVDVVAVLLRLLAKAKELPGGQVAALAGTLPGVPDMKAPFVFGLRTGAALTGEFRIPLGSLDSIGKVVQGVFGAAGPPRSR